MFSEIIKKMPHFMLLGTRSNKMKGTFEGLKLSQFTIISFCTLRGQINSNQDKKDKLHAQCK